MKILGVQFQSNLRWNLHIDNVCKIAARKIFVLKQLKKFGATKEELLQVYKAIILSVLE